MLRITKKRKDIVKAWKVTYQLREAGYETETVFGDYVVGNHHAVTVDWHDNTMMVKYVDGHGNYDEVIYHRIGWKDVVDVLRGTTFLPWENGTETERIVPCPGRDGKVIRHKPFPAMYNDPWEDRDEWSNLWADRVRECGAI